MFFTAVGHSVCEASNLMVHRTGSRNEGPLFLNEQEDRSWRRAPSPWSGLVRDSLPYARRVRDEHYGLFASQYECELFLAKMSINCLWEFGWNLLWVCQLRKKFSKDHTGSSDETLKRPDKNWQIVNCYDFDMQHFQSTCLCLWICSLGWVNRTACKIWLVQQKKHDFLWDFHYLTTVVLRCS